MMETAFFPTIETIPQAQIKWYQKMSSPYKFTVNPFPAELIVYHNDSTETSYVRNPLRFTPASIASPAGARGGDEYTLSDVPPQYLDP